MNIGIIVGSNRPKRAGGHIGQWVAEVAKTVEGANVTLLDLAEIKLPFLDELEHPSAGNYQNDHTKAWSKQITEQEGFIFVTPEYNHGYPAVLKNAIDTLANEWRNKPVSFVGYGVSGGTRAVEQLIPVVVQLDMKPQGGQINLPLYVQQDADGNYAPSEKDVEHVKTLVERLIAAK